MRSILPILIIAAALGIEPTRAADPQLRRLEPQGGQRGTQLTVSMLGERLGLDPQEVLWHVPGIEVLKVEKIDNNHTKVTLNIPADAHPGRYPLRLRTATGISNVMTFHVGSLPELSEVEPNSNPTEPQSIEFGSVVNGVVEREDVDYFTFSAQKGQRVSIEVEGLRLGRTLFDPVIILYDAADNELSRCDDWPAIRQDACLSLVAPADGKYLLELRESAYRGDENCNYRLHVGDFPRPLAVFPPGGRVGENLTIETIGDAKGHHTQSVQLPSVPCEEFAYYPSDEAGIAPSGFALRVVDMPVTKESEPNNGYANATASEAPGAFCGILQESKDRDHFRFTAKKGQVLHMHLHARRIGSPMDAVLRVRNGDGSNIAGNDDDRGYPDSYIRFQAPADGEYLAQIEDRLLRGGPTFVYWLEVKSETPSLEMKFEEQQQYVAKLLDVPRGNRNGAMISLVRKNVGGELILDWKNLPANVSVSHPKIERNMPRMPVIFSATEDAPLGQALVDVAARNVETNETVPTTFEQRNWMIRGQNNIDMWGYTGDRAVVAVTEKAPYTIRIVEPQSPLVQRGSKQLRIVAERAEGFDEPIYVRMLYNPPGVSSNNSLRIEKGKHEVVIPLTANDQAQVGRWDIAVRGQANSQGQLVTVTPLSTLTIREPYLSMELPRATLEQGQQVDYTITVEQHKPFTGEATVQLIGLPTGVTADPQSITKDTTEMTFTLKATADARPGRHRGLFCRVVITENNEPVTHSVGSGEVRVDKPLPPEPFQQVSR